MTIHFVMASPELPVHYTPGTQVIRATDRTQRTVQLDLRSTEEHGRAAWTYLHTTTDDPETAIVMFESMIPSYGCVCKNEYMTMKREFPPDMTDSDSFWRWGWFLHNLVNEKIGKPLIELEEARRIWNRPEPTE